MTLSKKDLGTKYDKGPQSECVLHFPERVDLTVFSKDKHAQFIIQVQIQLEKP